MLSTLLNSHWKFPCVTTAASARDTEQCIVFLLVGFFFKVESMKLLVHLKSSQWCFQWWTAVNNSIGVEICRHSDESALYIWDIREMQCTCEQILNRTVMLSIIWTKFLVSHSWFLHFCLKCLPANAWRHWFFCQGYKWPDVCMSWHPFKKGNHSVVFFLWAVSKG